MRISVVICTHNPAADRLLATLEALKMQTVPADTWETVIIDNASDHFPAQDMVAFHAPSNTRIVRESELGLTAARKRGLREARAPIVIFVDDDNVLDSDYLDASLELMESDPRIGAAGGRSFPFFEKQPESWHSEFFSLLALRDPGDKLLVTEPGARTYPVFAPIGAGLVLRATAAAAWLEKAVENAPPDRRGSSLSSAGDNDLVFTILEANWSVAYSPRLRLTHMIPASRLDAGYLARLNRGIQESWVRVLRLHNACPWPPLTRTGAAMRKVRAWLKHRAWRKGSSRVRWQGACGHFDGRVS
ncbi:MAG TPA: glycosyltransferase [Opitutaceae bacterium]|nr:glycosyltransferase [Opitutaceae bacterium]